jgi:hypothetical protein
MTTVERTEDSWKGIFLSDVIALLDIEQSHISINIDSSSDLPVALPVTIVYLLNNFHSQKHPFFRLFSRKQSA